MASLAVVQREQVLEENKVSFIARAAMSLGMNDKQRETSYGQTSSPFEANKATRRQPL